jgi:signal transduction histidine kinase
MIARDISERKEAEEQLIRHQEQLRNLAGELIKVEERERRQLAANLHDSVGQMLSLARMIIGKLRRSLKGSELAAEVEQASELVRQSIDSVRSLTFELSPPVLYDLGLEAAVEWLAESLEQQHGLTIGVQRKGAPTELLPEQRSMVFGVVRELLLNVVKHAHAGRAAVVIDSEDGELRIRVSDDGRGFDFESRMEHPSSGHGFGLFSVHERIRSLGGALNFSENEGGGTRAEITLPVEDDTGNNKEEAQQWRPE